MNFINLFFLKSKKITIKQWLILQLVIQKESEELRMLLQGDPSYFDWFEVNELIKFVKVPKDKFKSVRINSKGKAILTKCCIKDNSDEIEELCDRLIEEYETMNKPIGTRLNVLDRLIWFLSVTDFEIEEVEEAVLGYLHSSDEYTKRLDNLFWTPPSTAFSIHKNLKDSILYDRLNKEL